MTTSNKIQLVVVNEHTLGYIFPELPTSVQVLRASVFRGAPDTVQTIYSVEVSKNDNVRLANAKDFETYRVCFEGYENNQEEYEFAK